MARLLASSVLLLGIVVAGAPLRAADEAYTIKFKELGKGDTGSYDVREKGEIYVKLEDARGEALFDKTLKFNQTFVFWERVLEKPEGQAPTKTMRGYGEARLVFDDERIVYPMEGKRVRIERKGDKYTHSIEGSKETRPGKFENLLESELSQDLTMADFLPNKPVKLKETYRFNGKPLATALTKKVSDIEFDLTRVEALGRLTEVYDKDGRRFGKLVSDIRFPVKAITSQGKRYAMRKGDLMVLQVTFDTCIDGTAHVGIVKVVPYIGATAEVAEGGKKFVIKVAYKGERLITITEMKKK